LAITTSKQGKTSKGKAGRAPTDALYVNRLKKLQITSSSIVIIPKKFGGWQSECKRIPPPSRHQESSPRLGFPLPIPKIRNEAMPLSFGESSQGLSCGVYGWKGNNRVFRDRKRSAPIVVANIQAFFGEWAPYLCQPKCSGKLEEKEELWMDQFRIQRQNGSTANTPRQEDWEIRKGKQEFVKWKKERKAYILSFDGASKGNPGQAGGGGTIESPNAETMVRYALGLGIDTNNSAEAMALWQGLCQASKHGIQNLIIVGDSRLIIRAIIHCSKNQSAKLNNLLDKIRLLLRSFTSYKLFHVCES
jgi:hypothetical protein